MNEPRLPSGAALGGRVVLLSRHAGTARTVAQALGAAGIAAEQPETVERLEALPGGAALALIDLDLSPAEDPLALLGAARARCPAATVVALAGSDARRRLTSALSSGAVRHAVPKPLDGESGGFEGPDERDLCVALRRAAGRLDPLAGVAPYLAGGAALCERTIAASDEKDGAVAEVLALAARMGLGGELKRRIELTCEELILNALFDAPVDAAGAPRFAALDRDAPVRLDGGERIRLRWGCDGRAFALAVADPFGALRAETVAERLGRSLAPGGARPSRSGGGASLGLLLAFAAANQLVFSVVPGVATEVTAVIEVAGGNRRSLGRGTALHFYQARAA